MTSPVPPTRAPAPPRPAATVVLVRPAAAGFELLLLQRADQGDHFSSAWVFPGGVVETGDAACHACSAGLQDAQASARLGIDRGGLDFYVTAIRECFEEAGVLLATDAAGAFVDVDIRLAAQREPLRRGERDFAQLCHERGLLLAADRLAYIAHWVTPIGLPKRFDTRFFLAVLPPGQASAHDMVETVDHVWLSPGRILALENTRRLLKVTRAIVEMMVPFDDLAALVRWAHVPRSVPRVMQRRCQDASGPRTVMPQHPAFAEIGRLDPEGSGSAWCELRPGQSVRLAPRVQRLSQPGNPRTNAYLVGDAASGWTHVEPGTPLPTIHGVPRLQALRDPADPARCVGWLLVEEGMLFTGTAWQGAADLPDALRPSVRWIAPAHGFLIPVE